MAVLSPIDPALTQVSASKRKAIHLLLLGDQRKARADGKYLHSNQQCSFRKANSKQFQDATIESVGYLRSLPIICHWPYPTAIQHSVVSYLPQRSKTFCCSHKKSPNCLQMQITLIHSSSNYRPFQRFLLRMWNRYGLPLVLNKLLKLLFYRMNNNKLQINTIDKC